jgi:hypothetical protein
MRFAPAKQSAAPSSRPVRSPRPARRARRGAWRIHARQNKQNGWNAGVPSRRYAEVRRVVGPHASDMVRRDRNHPSVIMWASATSGLSERSVHVPCSAAAIVRKRGPKTGRSLARWSMQLCARSHAAGDRGAGQPGDVRRRRLSRDLRRAVDTTIRKPPRRGPSTPVRRVLSLAANNHSHQRTGRSTIASPASSSGRYDTWAKPAAASNRANGAGPPT